MDKSRVTMPERYQSERQLADAVRQLATACGWHVYLTYKSKHSPKGEPDLRMVRPPRVIFAELKSFHGRVTKEQAETLELLRQCPGVEVHLWRPQQWDEIVGILG
jgi:hypothetical protein